MAEKIWTGRRFIILDNATQIEVLMPGDRSYGKYVYGGNVRFVNESTEVKVHTTKPYSEYEDGYILLQHAEADIMLEALGKPELFEVREELNKEARAEFERLQRDEEGYRQEYEDLPY